VKDHTPPPAVSLGSSPLIARRSNWQIGTNVDPLAVVLTEDDLMTGQCSKPTMKTIQYSSTIHRPKRRPKNVLNGIIDNQRMESPFHQATIILLAAKPSSTGNELTTSQS
jgi:hypothetical protein